MREIFNKANKSSKEKALMNSLKKLFESSDIGALLEGNSKEEMATLRRRIEIVKSVLDGNL